MKDHIHAKGTDIAVVSSGDENDYISLTDIARYKSAVSYTHLTLPTKA